MNEALKDTLRCMMVKEFSMLLLNLKWGVTCNPKAMLYSSFTAASYLWLLESGCTLDINILADMDKYVHQISQTAYQCSTIICEDKNTTTACDGLVVTDNITTNLPCGDITMTDISPVVVNIDDP